MFPSGNFIGYNNNGQPVHQQQTNFIQGHSSITSQIPQMQIHANQTNSMQSYPFINSQSSQIPITPTQSTSMTIYPSQQDSFPSNQERHKQIQQQSNRQQITRLISTSDEEPENINNDNPWQVVSVERKKTATNKENNRKPHPHKQ